MVAYDQPQWYIFLAFRELLHLHFTGNTPASTKTLSKYHKNVWSNVMKMFWKMLKSYENVWFCNDQENIFITLDNNINKTFKTHFLNIKLWCYNNIILMLSRMFTKHINNIFTMFESYVIKMLHLYLINIWRKCLKNVFNLFLRPYILIWF